MRRLSAPLRRLAPIEAAIIAHDADLAVAKPIDASPPQRINPRFGCA
jgi:hypothetical protein